MPPDRPQTRQIIWLLLGLATLFVVVWRMPPLSALQGVPIMALPVHMVAEIFSIVVSVMVFGIAWNAYSKDRSGRIVFVGCVLLAVGLIDLAHMMSFAGMPDLVTPSSAEKAINFWLSARLVFALGLLIAAFRPWVPLASPLTRYRLLTAGLVVPAAVFWLGLFHPGIWPRTFIQGQGLTAFKIGAEYAIIAILLVAAVRLYLLAIRPQAQEEPGLFAATAITILSELSFTLYSDVADIQNLLGHLFKILAYFFIYRSVFVACVREPFQRLEEMLDSKNEFIATVSHELRTPLTAVLGFAQVLQDPASALSPGDRAEFRQSIVDEGVDLSNIVDDLLVAARVETGALSVAQVRVDLRAQVAQVLEGMHLESDQQLEVSGGAVLALGDPARVRQINRNLVSNAMRHGGGTIRVDLGGDDATARLAVIDDGPGVTAEEQHRIFEPYWQANQEPSQPLSLGLGLSLSRDLARLMDGDLVYRREAGETIFELSLRRADRET